jgi:hypothetical protein
MGPIAGLDAVENSLALQGIELGPSRLLVMVVVVSKMSKLFYQTTWCLIPYYANLREYLSVSHRL